MTLRISDSIVFVLANAEDYPRTIGPIIPIASPDTVAAKHNEGLMLGLTCLIVFFAALDLRTKIDTQQVTERVKESNPEDVKKEKAAETAPSTEPPKTPTQRRERKSRQNRSKNQ